MIDRFKSQGVRIETRETPGGHEWANWRLYLFEVAPNCFGERQGRPRFGTMERGVGPSTTEPCAAGRGSPARELMGRLLPGNGLRTGAGARPAVTWRDGRAARASGSHQRGQTRGCERRSPTQPRRAADDVQDHGARSWPVSDRAVRSWREGRPEPDERVSGFPGAARSGRQVRISAAGLGDPEPN